MITRALIKGIFGFQIILFSMISDSSFASWLDDCYKSVGADRAACEAQEILVTGTPTTAPPVDPGPTYTPGITTTPPEPTVPLAPSTNSDSNDTKTKEERDECIANAEQAGAQCEFNYNIYGTGMCAFSTGVLARHGGRLVTAAFAKSTYALGASTTMTGGCSSLAYAATQWCQEETERKIERECS